jgi:hypothetical protein
MPAGERAFGRAGRPAHGRGRERAQAGLPKASLAERRSVSSPSRVPPR